MSPLGGHKEVITHDRSSLMRLSLPRSTTYSFCTSLPDIPPLYYREDEDDVDEDDVPQLHHREDEDSEDEDDDKMPALRPRSKNKSHSSCNSLPIKPPATKNVTFEASPCPQKLMPPRPATQPSSQSEPASTLPQKAPNFRYNRENPHPKSLQGYVHVSTILGKPPVLLQYQSLTQSIPVIQTKPKTKDKYHRTHDSTVKPFKPACQLLTGRVLNSPKPIASIRNPTIVSPSYTQGTIHTITSNPTYHVHLSTDYTCGRAQHADHKIPW